MPDTGAPATPYTLFEVAWEVCNKVGGIHTVVSTKARTLVERFGDAYVAIGPWLLSQAVENVAFEAEKGFEDFEDACRAMGVPVRVGRWLEPGRPRTILVESSGLLGKRDAVLAGLWDRHRVDSMSAGWDYVEPVLFGEAAGMVVEAWWRRYLAGAHGRVVAQCHEWLTASALAYLKDHVPEIGTVFTTHATVLGRAIASSGVLPQDGLAGRRPEEAAEALGVRSKHSLEGAAIRAADVFTTVSDATAEEAALFHGRRPDPVQPNGIDVEALHEELGNVPQARVDAAVRDLAARFLGEDLGDAALLCISGRYEFHNKGIDLFLDALGAMNARTGRRVVAFVFVPAGNSGLRHEVEERRRAPLSAIRGPVGVATHNLFETDRDPVQRRCSERGIANAVGSRVKLLHVPIYLQPGDGLLDLPYEAVVRSMDLTCFPSFYEPWGYTPQESLAVGVPTITSCCAGFGGWAEANGIGPRDGVYVVRRKHVPDATACAKLVEILEAFVAEPHDREKLAKICRATASRTSWTDLVASQYEAFSRAVDAAQERVARLPPSALAAGVRPVVRLTVPARLPRLTKFDVAASVPETLRGLERLSRNYWWTWDAEAESLFEELSPRTWDACRANPVQLLRQAAAEDFRRAAGDADYVARLAATAARFDAYVGAAPAALDVGDGARIDAQRPVVYLCAEFGIHASLPCYSGGLGVLAGDHLKSASDLGLPLVGVGLLYRKGYPRQRVSTGGEQVEAPVEVDPHALPMDPALDAAGRPVETVLQFPGRSVTIRGWRVLVGRTPLYLLDADVESNRPEDRAITDRLYDADQESRLRQEIVLGRGAARFLSQIGLRPSVWHFNEGHVAFAAIERVGRLVREEGLTFDEARELVQSRTIFTTHTPIPAGHDRFPEDLIRRYFSDAPSWIGLPWERFFALGATEDDATHFEMTRLALHFAGEVNGVSRRHAEVTKGLFRRAYPALLEEEVPVQAIANGVHLPTWTAPAVARLFGAAQGRIVGSDFAEGAPHLDLAALSKARDYARGRLIESIRSRLRAASVARRESPSVRRRALAGLDPRALYVGFARRMVPYKRATLIFHDLDRLRDIVNQADRPVRIVFAGKAHAGDGAGKAVVRRLAEIARTEGFLGRVFLVEDYDMTLARDLVQGCDVWLSTPARALEASGTSGMKSAANGGLNVSTLDAWWAEAFDGKNGWSIEEAMNGIDDALRDELDAASLYQVLEDEIVPMFFERDERGLSAAWLERVRRSLATIPPVFNTDRMLAEYRDRAYVPLARASFRLASERDALARSTTREHQRMRRGFAGVRIVATHLTDTSAAKVGDVLAADAEVDLASLHPDDVSVELVVGRAAHDGDARDVTVVPLEHEARPAGPTHRFRGRYSIAASGTFASGIRVRARDVDGPVRAFEDLVLWA